MQTKRRIAYTWNHGDQSSPKSRSKVDVLGKALWVLQKEKHWTGLYILGWVIQQWPSERCLSREPGLQLVRLDISTTPGQSWEAGSLLERHCWIHIEMLSKSDSDVSMCPERDTPTQKCPVLAPDIIETTSLSEMSPIFGEDLLPLHYLIWLYGYILFYMVIFIF